MRDGIMLTVAEDGTARVYDDTYDIVIHCESQEEHDKAVAMLRGIKPKTTGSGFNSGESGDNKSVRTTDDTISRQAANDLFPNDDLEWDTKGGYVAPHLARRMIEELPPAQPEQRWIPVSERLPEDSEYHLVTEYHMVSFARYWEHRWWDAFGDKAKFVTAWMPLPEPWEGEENGKIN